mgnify:CR=1 FL=1
MRVKINAQRCQGHTLCNMVAPQVFQLRDEDGHAFVIDAEVPGHLEALVLEAQNGCPEQAIIIDE